MQVREALTAVATVLGWALLLASIPVYLFHWRVANEPGAGPALGLLIATIFLLGAGGLLLIGGHIYLLFKKAWILLLVVWEVCIALLVGAVFLSPVLLLFMV